MEGFRGPATLGVSVVLLAVLGLCSGCMTWEFRCDNGDCIKASGRCNGHQACSDGSDETHCPIYPDNPFYTPRPCTSQEFQCRNGKCIYPGWRCDGENDCEDGSDEEFCPEEGSSSVMTTASIIGLVVAVVGLMMVLSGIGVMLLCARRKIARNPSSSRRRSRRTRREDIGPYGRGFPPSMTADLVVREPPPRYTSTDNLAMVNPAFLPPPCYSSKPDLNMVSEYVEPPPYCSHQSLPAAYGSRRGTLTSLDNPQGNHGYCDKAGCEHRRGSCPLNYNSLDDLSSKSSQNHDDSMYEGFTPSQKRLLDTIVQTARPGARHMRPEGSLAVPGHGEYDTSHQYYSSMPAGVDSRANNVPQRKSVSVSSLPHNKRLQPDPKKDLRVSTIAESQETIASSLDLDLRVPSIDNPAYGTHSPLPCFNDTSPPAITITAALPATPGGDKLWSVHPTRPAPTLPLAETSVELAAGTEVLDVTQLVDRTYREPSSEC